MKITSRKTTSDSRGKNARFSLDNASVPAFAVSVDSSIPNTDSIRHLVGTEKIERAFDELFKDAQKAQRRLAQDISK